MKKHQKNTKQNQASGGSFDKGMGAMPIDDLSRNKIFSYLSDKDIIAATREQLARARSLNRLNMLQSSGALEIRPVATIRRPERGFRPIPRAWIGPWLDAKALASSSRLWLVSARAWLVSARAEEARQLQDNGRSSSSTAHDPSP